MPLHTTIFKTLQSNPLSLAALQPITQVSLPTLRKAVQELSDNRWIRVVGQSETNGGRPPMLFGLDETYYSLLGVQLQLPGIRMIISDLNGKVLEEVEAFQGTQPTPGQVVQAIIDYVLEAETRLNARKILGVGIAAPGYIEPETGNIISIGRVSGWQDFPIRQRLQSQLNLPVRIANDVDCMAFAELQHAPRPDASNLAYVGFDEGVKVSMFLNGEIYIGSFGNAGLIITGFLKVPGVDLSLEEQQRMLTISGINHTFEQMVATRHTDEQASYREILETNYRGRLEQIFLGAQHGMDVCSEMVGILNPILATAIASVIYIVQPDTVVLGGLLGAMPATLLTELSTSIRGYLPTLFANRIHIEQAQFSSSNMAAKGANYYFIEDYLLSESTNLIIRTGN